MKRLIYQPDQSLMDLMYDYLNDARTESSDVLDYSIAETDKLYEIEIVAPGFTKESFKISVDDNHLVVNAEMEKKEESSDKKWHKKKHFKSSFAKKFKLNNKVSSDEITANYRDGILKIDLPKTKQKLDKIITVK